MNEILKFTIPVLSLLIPILGSLWVTTNQIINSKASERISLLRREFADFYAYCAMIIHLNNVEETIKLNYAKSAFHIVFLLNSESKEEKEMRELLTKFVNKIPQYIEKPDVNRKDIATDMDTIGRKFDLIMKIENEKLRRNLVHKLVHFIYR